jgi:hypothetical protein
MPCRARTIPPISGTAPEDQNPLLTTLQYLTLPRKKKIC